MHARRLLALTCAALLVARPAGAADPPPAPAALDTVEFRDGGLIRGTIVELRPGESVTIRGVDGVPRTFPWSEVAATLLARPEPAPAHAAPAHAALAPPLLVPGPGTPRLTIRAPARRPVHLFTAGGGALVVTPTTTAVRSGVVLRSVCQAPCGQVIDARDGYPYFFGGDRMPLSRPIYLNHGASDLVADVRPGRLGLLLGGVLAATYGGAGVLTGAALLGVAPERFARPGGAVLGVGAALLVSGIIMAVHGQTRFKLRPR